MHINNTININNKLIKAHKQTNNNNNNSNKQQKQ